MKRLYPILIFFILGLFLFGKTLIPPPGYMLYGGDIQDQFYWWKSYLVESVRAGDIPFWNPYSFSGTPFLAHPSVAPFYPFTILFFLYPIQIAFSLYLLIHLCMAGYFMYWFVQKKYGFWSGILSGIIFGFSGFMFARIYAGHVDIISTVSWMPFVFGAVTEALKTKEKNYTLLAVFAFTLQILAGYQFAVLITVVLLSVYTVGKIFDEINCRKKSLISPHRGAASWQFTHLRSVFSSECLNSVISTTFIFLTIILLSYGISAIQYLPTLQFIQHSIRADGLPYSLATWGSYTLSMFRLFLAPFSLGNPFPEQFSYIGPGPNYFEISFYIGIVPIFLILLLLGINVYNVIAKRKVDLFFWFCTISVIFFGCLSLGNNSFLHPTLFLIVPLLRLFRFPSQYLIAVVFLFSILSGIALSKIRYILLKLLIIIIAIFDLFLFDKQFIRIEQIAGSNFDQKLIKTVKQESAAGRVLNDYTVVSSIRKDWDFESAAILGIPIAGGYNPIVLKSYYHFIDLANKSPSSSIPYFNVEIPPLQPEPQILKYLNIRYVLVDKNQEQRKIRSGKSQLLEGNRYILYELPDYLPRYFLVDRVAFFSNSQSLESAIRLSLVDLERQVAVIRSKDTKTYEKLADCSSSKTGKVSFSLYTINTVELEVDAPCDSFISSSEVNYPGWKVAIDGKAGQLFEGNTAFRTFFVPKGQHKIEVYYDPLIYRVGGAITLLSMGIFYLFYRRDFPYVS